MQTLQLRPSSVSTPQGLQLKKVTTVSLQNQEGDAAAAQECTEMSPSHPVGTVCWPELIERYALPVVHAGNIFPSGAGNYQFEEQEFKCHH